MSSDAASLADQGVKPAVHPPGKSGKTLDAVKVQASTAIVNSNEIDTKRNADVQVDSLDANSIQIHAQEDSVAQKLMTAPGISVLRDEDQPRYITARGIQPDLDSTTLDGMTMASVGDSGGGAREINLEMIPSDIADRIDVYKTYSAEQPADGVGDAINLVTNSAFDHPANTLHVDLDGNYHAIHNDNGANSMPKTVSPWGDGISAKYSTVFGSNHEWGLTVSALEQDYNADQNKLFQTTQYFYNTAGSNISGPNIAGWNGMNAPGSIAYYADNRRLKTYGGSMKLEWWPSNGPFRASLMAYAYGQEERRTENGYQFNLAKSVTEQTPTSGTGTVSSMNDIYTNTLWERNNRGLLSSFQWHQDNQSLAFRAGYTRDRINYVVDNMTLTATPTGDTSASYGSASNGEIYNLTSLTNPGIIGNSAYAVSNAYQDHTRGIAEVGDLRLDYSNNIDPESRGFGLAAGIEYKQMHVMTRNDDTIYDNGTDLSDDLYYPSFQYPNALYSLPFFDYSKFMSQGGWSSLAINQATSKYDSEASDFDYNEKVRDAYLSLHYATDRVEAVAGLRYDATEYNSYTPYINDGAISGFTTNRGDYHYPLPSLNVTTHLTDSINLRTGLSRTIGRPIPSNIAQAESETCASGECTIALGNPNLKPEKSFNMDVSLEKYWNDGKGYMSLGWFKKNIKDNIISTSTEAYAADGTLITTTTPENVSKSSIQGVELSLVERALEWGNHSFDVMFNATHMDGQMTYTSSSGSREVYQLLDQPRNIANLGVTWHLPWLNSRLTIAENYTDNYLITLGASPWSDRGFRGRITTDAGWEMSLNRHWTLAFSVTNLFGKNQYETLGDNYQYMRNLNNYGATYYAHVRFDL
ncbi:TonB-dependent receptor [Frateuria aurantia]